MRGQSPRRPLAGVENSACDSIESSRPAENHAGTRARLPRLRPPLRRHGPHQLRPRPEKAQPGPGEALRVRQSAPPGGDRPGPHPVLPRRAALPSSRRRGRLLLSAGPGLPGPGISAASPPSAASSSSSPSGSSTPGRKGSSAGHERLRLPHDAARDGPRLGPQVLALPLSVHHRLLRHGVHVDGLRPLRHRPLRRRPDPLLAAPGRPPPRRRARSPTSSRPSSGRSTTRCSSPNGSSPSAPAP